MKGDAGSGDASPVDVMVDAKPNPLSGAYIKASNTGLDDRFGHGISMSADGTTLVVGAPDEDSNARGINYGDFDNSFEKAGAAYVFIRSEGVWAQSAYLKASNADAGDRFGFAVAASGDGRTIAVSARDECSCMRDVESSNSCCGAGAVYVFVRSSDGMWSQQAYVKSSHPASSRFFGETVALSSDGNTLAVGAPGDASPSTGIGGDPAGNTATLSGAVFVFKRTGATWAQQAYIKASNAEQYDVFGNAVALSASGDVMVVGATGEKSGATGVGGSQLDNGVNYAGAAYVFGRSGSTWSQHAYLKASNTGTDDFFGMAVAVSESGNTIAVGAYGEDSANPTDPTDDTALLAGAVYVFQKQSTWMPQAYVKAAAPKNSDYFGISVALSATGDALLVGMSGDDTDATGIDGTPTSTLLSESGAVDLFKRSGATWFHAHRFKADYPDAGDLFGHDVSMSGDARLIAVGAMLEASAATGINGDATNDQKKSGAAYVVVVP